MVGVGIIGCGYISRFHFEGFAAAGAHIAHVCDINRAAAEPVAAQYGAALSTDYRAVIDDPAVQLISVTTTAASHKEICLAAIAAGKGVVCEKTLTDTAADSAEIARAAEVAGVFFMTAYMKRFFPAMRQAKEMLAEMGDLISVHARTWQPWNLWTSELGPDMLEHPSGVMRKYAGGILVCGGSHILDLLHWYTGRPTAVFGHLHFREGMDIDIRANALLWPERGGLVSLEACWHPLKYGGYERNGWDERLEINTTRGRLDLYTITWNFPERNAPLLVHQDAETGRTTEYRFPVVNAFHAEMAEALRRFQAGEPGMPSAWDGYVVDEAIAHITESSRRQEKLTIAYADRPVAV